MHILTLAQAIIARTTVYFRNYFSLSSFKILQLTTTLNEGSDGLDFISRPHQTPPLYHFRLFQPRCLLIPVTCVKTNLVFTGIQPTNFIQQLPSGLDHVISTFLPVEMYHENSLVAHTCATIKQRGIHMLYSKPLTYQGRIPPEGCSQLHFRVSQIRLHDQATIYLQQ